MRIEIDTEAKTITVGSGLRISFDLLEMLDAPDPRRCYRLERTADKVIVHRMVEGGHVRDP